MNRATTNFSVLTLLCLSLISTAAQASIGIRLQAPKWEFLLANQLPTEKEAKLNSNESAFARQLQPLLAANSHTAIIDAFAKRDIEQDSAALQLLRGQVLLSLKEFSAAERALQLALNSLPDLALAHRSLSMLYMAQKQYRKAREHLTKSIQLGVADDQVFGQLAFVNLQTGYVASAVAGYQHALFLAPENKQWQQGLLYALIKTQASQQAQALLDEMLLDDSNNADLWLQRGQIALQQGNQARAISSLETALTLGASPIDNVMMMAQLHLQNGSQSRAVALLNEHLVQLVADKRQHLHIIEQIAQWLFAQQQWTTLNELLAAIAKVEGDLSAIEQAKFSVLRAQLALNNNNTELAQRKLNSVLKVDPNNGEALLNLASLYYQQQQIAKASMYYARAQALPDFKERALTGQAQIAIDQQEYSQALKLLRKLVKLTPNRTELLANIRSLEQLVRQQG